MKPPCSLLRTGENYCRLFLGGIFFILISGTIFGQQITSTNATKPVSSTTAKVNFSVKPFTPYFVENKGQFDQYGNDKGNADYKIASYGSQMGNAIVLFNGKSIEFVENIIKNKERDKEEKEKNLLAEREFETWRQTMTFVDANPNAEFVATESQTQYYTYPDPNIKNGTITANVWKGLIEKNIYPGIDLVLSYREDGGIKYSFIINPGADASQIKIKWSGVENLVIDEKGNLTMKSENGIMTDHAPKTFYESGGWYLPTIVDVDSKFILNGKTISFDIAKYDHTKTLVIDPWVFSPNLTGNNRAYDIQHDPAGNIYCYGGSNPYQLQKYTSLGAPIWTYNTSATGYYGDFTIDAGGNAFCIYGPWGDQCVKITPAGAQVWSVSSGNSQREIYRVYPNPVNGQLTIMGIEIPGTGGQWPMELNIDPNSGAYSPSYLHPTCGTGETRCMSVDANGDAFGLVFFAVSSVNNAADNLIWRVNSANVTTGSVVDGYLLGEVDPSNTDSWFSGFNGTAIGCDLFTYDGQTVKKWDKTSLTLLGSVAIPGGIHYVTGGLCTDACGNVYVGGPNSIMEYDNNLNLITSVATGTTVYDVNVGNIPGEILGCGDQFFGSYTFPVNSCTTTSSIAPTNATTCACNGSATVTVSSPACTSGSYTYQWSPMGGTSATATNLCPGTYTCYFTNTSTGVVDSLSVTITGPTGNIIVTGTVVNASCSASTGSVTANPSGGQGPYTYLWAPGGQTTQTISNVPGGSYTVTVTDANGCTQIQTFNVNTTSGMSSTLSSTQPTCTGCNGTATVNPVGGTGPFTYSWTTAPIQTTQTATSLCPGTYSVTITDANGCLTDTVLTLTANNPMTLTTAMGPPLLCFGDCTGSATANPASGQAPYTYSWNTTPVQTTQTATNLCAGNYTVTVTDANGCTQTQPIVVTQPAALAVTTTSPIVICAGKCTTLSANANGGTPGYSYNWVPGPIVGNNQQVCPVATTTYTLALTDANGCARIDSVVVTVNPLPVIAFVADTLQGCAPLCVNFTNNTPNTQTITWEYGDNTSNGNGVHCYNTGTYNVSAIVVGTNGCSDTLTINAYIQAFPSPVAGFTSPLMTVSMLDPSFCFQDQSSGASIWQYNFNDPLNPTNSNLQNPCHTYSDTGFYCVDQVVTNSNGCRDSTQLCIEVLPEPGDIYVPNTFTPNGNGLNEIFMPVGFNISNEGYHFMVFDRWGMLIYETHTWGDGWDGTLKGNKCQIDTYVWKVDARDIEGTKFQLIGHVNLIR
jgi:gliding motility-associated-like protein